MKTQPETMKNQKSEDDEDDEEDEDDEDDELTIMRMSRIRMMITWVSLKSSGIADPAT